VPHVKLHQEGVKRQNINVSRVIFHCAVWGVFGIPPEAKCGGAKLVE